MTVGSLWWDTDTHIHRGKKNIPMCELQITSKTPSSHVISVYIYICGMLWFDSHSLFSATLLFPFIKIWRDNETLKHHDNRTQTHANICIVGVCIQNTRTSNIHYNWEYLSILLMEFIWASFNNFTPFHRICKAAHIHEFSMITMKSGNR